MKGKKLRVVNKFRFVTFLILCLLIMTIFISSMFKSNTVYSDNSSEDKYIGFQVVEGDTLWEIAKSNNPYNYDIREVVYDIMKLNNMSNADIRPGDIVKLPYH